MHPDPQRIQIASAQRRRAAGVAYVTILGIASIVLTIGVVGIAASRAISRAADQSCDIAEARLHAQSALDIGRVIIAQNSYWRSTYSNGPWITNQPIGGGHFSLDVTNPSGALNALPIGPVVVTGTGTKGNAVQKVQVTLSPLVTPYTCLNAAMFAGSNITLSSGTISPVGCTIAANGNIIASSSAIAPSAQAAGICTGGTYQNGSASLVATRTAPATATVFSQYLASGTTINITSIPVISGSRHIRGVLISPTVNPYTGVTNASGIYIIDCQGATLVITDCRIVGTLVLLNPGWGTTVRDYVNWSPAVANYPCLMVQGNVTLDMKSDDTVGESAVNYNPPGTPYPFATGGTANTTLANQYPATITGLVYASGNITTTSHPTVGMLIAGGSITASNHLALSYDPSILTNPPPGFFTATMPVVSGSFKQVVSP